MGSFYELFRCIVRNDQMLVILCRTHICLMVVAQTGASVSTIKFTSLVSHLYLYGS